MLGIDHQRANIGAVEPGADSGNLCGSGRWSLHSGTTDITSSGRRHRGEHSGNCFGLQSDYFSVVQKWIARVRTERVELDVQSGNDRERGELFPGGEQ